jgi:hypothetical protein
VTQQAQAEASRELQKERSNWQRSQLSLESKIKELERQMRRRTANEIGDEGEFDLLRVLRASFGKDEITPVQKGAVGPDIIQVVFNRGEVCGKIIFDSKRRRLWHQVYVTKIKADQIAEKADHAIIATNVFPRAKKELCLQNGVIVVAPDRVVEVIELLRGFMIRLHSLGASLTERGGKTSRLYKYIVSEQYLRRFGEAKELTDSISNMDVDETRAHQKVWQKRETMVKRLRNALRDVESEISAIVEGRE